MKTIMKNLIPIGVMLSFPSIAFASADILYSSKTVTPVTLDAVAESQWDKAQPLELLLDQTPYKPREYEGMTSTLYSIQSLYDDEYIYFFVKWNDPTKSLERYPWVKQNDGTWKQLKNKDQTNHENTYYEDKAGIYWEIKARGFKKKGCDISCHIANDKGEVAGIEQTSAGRKFTRKAGESIDMWHWKGVRTGLTDQFDDQFVDSTKDPKANKNWGRKGDSKTGGGYKDNANKDKSAPAFGNNLFDTEKNYAVLVEGAEPFVRL